MNLSQRSYKKELLDSDDISFEDIRQNMKELDVINRWLGGHRITLKAFKSLLGEKKQISVCEIGCGGGDNLAAISSYCARNSIDFTAIGIDLKKECIDFAEGRHHLAFPTKWIVSDFAEIRFEVKPDIIFSSLFCHHFTNEQLHFQLQWMQRNCNLGFFINDLHRHFLAYHSIKLLTNSFSSSYLVKNDAPLSVARGFKKAELKKLCDNTGIPKAEIQWQWAFRFLITFRHER